MSVNLGIMLNLLSLFFSRYYLYRYHRTGVLLENQGLYNIFQFDEVLPLRFY